MTLSFNRHKEIKNYANFLQKVVKATSDYITWSKKENKQTLLTFFDKVDRDTAATLDDTLD